MGNAGGEGALGAGLRGEGADLGGRADGTLGREGGALDAAGEEGFAVGVGGALELELGGLGEGEGRGAFERGEGAHIYRLERSFVPGNKFDRMLLFRLEDQGR